ncbi:MAG: nucleotidyltransferase domain-containing protein [Nanoarchaeota archaeon]|nr:nucleotidyltransferase domain-containing protein [Nanoarchaeota archaeon]
MLILHSCNAIYLPFNLNCQTQDTNMNGTLKPLFFSESLRRWHFEDIVKESGMSRGRVNYFLRQLLRENFIKRVKSRGRMPFYQASRESPGFRTEKRVYGLMLLEQSGLLRHISGNSDIKTAIIFGSFSRGDWNKSSDIDLFIYGDDANFDKAGFEKKTSREIQLFSFKSAREMKRQLDFSLLPNIARGFSIKESIEPFRVDINA